MLQLYDTSLLGLEAGYCYDCLVWFGTVSLCGVSSFIFVNLNTVLYLRVCIYAVPSPLLMHSQLIELVVRNTGGVLCVACIFSAIFLILMSNMQQQEGWGLF